MMHYTFSHLHVRTSGENRALFFAQKDAEKQHVESSDKPTPETKVDIKAETVDTDAPVSALKALEETEGVTLSQVRKHKAALEAANQIEKHERPFTKEDRNFMNFGELKDVLPALVAKTDNEYFTLRNRPSDKQKAFAVKTALAEKAQIEKYIAEHKAEWDADQDVVNGRSMSMVKRNLLERLARIDEIQRYEPNRRLATLKWREEQRLKTVADEAAYEQSVLDMLQSSEGSRYPLTDGLKTFLTLALGDLHNTQKARKDAESRVAKLTPDVQQAYKDVIRSAAQREAHRIKLNYEKWLGTPCEQIMRNRYTQLQLEADNLEYKRDLGRIGGEKTEEQRIEEWLEFHQKGSAEKMRKRDSKGRLLYSNLSDHDRQEFLRHQGSASAKTITQFEFDKKHFHARHFYSDEKMPTMSEQVRTAINTSVDSILQDLRVQPPQAPEIQSGSISHTALKIEEALRSLVRDNAQTKAADVLKVYLQEMKNVAPQRVKSVTETSFKIQDDDGQFRWYECETQQDGSFILRNLNTVVVYKRVDEEERDRGLKNHIIYRSPAEEDIDIEWDEYRQAGNADLPESTPFDPADSAERQSEIALHDIREIRGAENLRRATTVQKAIRYFDDVFSYETMTGEPIPYRHRLQVERMVRDLNTMFRTADNTAVNAIAGRDVVGVIDHMEKYLKGEEKNLIPDLNVPDELSQDPLTPEQEDAKIQSIDQKSVDGGWIDASRIEFGSRGWKYKKGEGNRYYAKFGGTIDVCFYNGQDAKWTDYAEAFIGKNPSAATTKMFKNLLRRGADRMWVKDHADNNASYHIDLDGAFLLKKVGETEFFFSSKKEKWVESN